MKSWYKWKGSYQVQEMSWWPRWFANCLPGSAARGRAGDVVPLEPLDGLVEDGGGPVLALVHPGVEGGALVVFVVCRRTRRQRPGVQFKRHLQFWV